MATTLSTTARVSLGWNFTNTTSFGADTGNSGSFDFSDVLTNGTATDQADRLYLTKATIAGGSNVEIDLAGELEDVFGNTITFARVKSMYVELTTDTTSTSIEVGGAASNAFVGPFGADDNTIEVKNGGVFFYFFPGQGHAVTAGTGDLLLLTNNDSTNTATYRLGIVGTSA
jgi:hypothetical protein